MEGPIAILGATGFLGSNVAQLIQKNDRNVEVREWVPFVSPDSSCSHKLELFVGEKQIEDCLNGVKLIINCHEARDLSLNPKLEVLAEHNENFVALVRKLNPCPFVHVSTVLVQCSNFWPNVFEPERDGAKYSSRWPCKAYCKSKLLAEQASFSANDDVIVLRIPFLYGEGDTGSIVTDAILFADYFGSQIPNIGDRGGAFQMAYVRNIAQGIEDVATKLLAGEFNKREIMIMADDTRIGDPYSTILEPYAKNPKRPLSPVTLPFLPLYYVYLLITWLLLLVNRLVNIGEFLAKLPDPSLLYLVFHHWTFFNTNKASFLLPKHLNIDREFVDKISRTHYNCLIPSELKASWTLKIDNE
ncbi:unnamed protein product, partial [Mesorhabditis belari]|uniref:3-beta hydroxysteroid dehydrogenase/isomerase domain-containing protein n=1 Tax=Mesorhabditis belari TaxID=2138241 RepID=A0AAF3J1R8_9BILA